MRRGELSGTPPGLSGWIWTYQCGPEGVRVVYTGNDGPMYLSFSETLPGQLRKFDTKTIASKARVDVSTSTISSTLLPQTPFAVDLHYHPFDSHSHFCPTHKYPEPTMSKMATLGLGHASTAPRRSTHDRREPSGGAFTMFSPQQVKQFKEAFNMIDQDGDGRVTEGDLKVMLSNLGKWALGPLPTVAGLPYRSFCVCESPYV